MIMLKKKYKYHNNFSFSLYNKENVNNINKNKHRRYLLNIGAHGTDYYLDLVDEFRKDADKLYRPTGRVLPLNRQLAALEKQEQRLADLEARNESYVDLIEENNRQLNEIDRKSTRLNSSHVAISYAVF